MIEKVTDEAIMITNPHLRKVLADKGIDADYVELFHDYAPRSRGKEYAPNARFYRDRKSGQGIAEFSILPHCDTLGRKIDCRWILSDGKYYSGINLFSAAITGSEIKVTCLSDQPHGARKDDWVSWKPQLFLDGVEQLRTEAILLTTDPINAGYHDNTIEWDYGICKRRIRIIEGRIREKWIPTPATFELDPNDMFRVKHNHQGNYHLRLGEYAINDDEEVFPAKAFGTPENPLEIRASPETFYPDPSVEVSSVDGECEHTADNSTWAQIRDGAGTAANDSAAQAYQTFIQAGSDNETWASIHRGIYVIDVSGLPDGCTVTGATFSIRGTGVDNDPWELTLNVYSSAPALNTAIVAGDFNSLGVAAYCDTGIAGTSWNTAGYNDFAFNANPGIAAVQAASDGNTVVKLGTRDATYDVADSPPAYAGGNPLSWFYGYTADQANTTSDPKLVVTYTLVTFIPTVTII